jgi:hypothetical protein
VGCNVEQRCSVGIVERLAAKALQVAFTKELRKRYV